MEQRQRQRQPQPQPQTQTHGQHSNPPLSSPWLNPHRDSLHLSYQDLSRTIPTSRRMMDVNEMLNTNTHSSSGTGASPIEGLRSPPARRVHTHDIVHMDWPASNHTGYGHPFIQPPFHHQQQLQPHPSTQQSLSSDSQQSHHQAIQAEQSHTQPRPGNNPNAYENEAYYMSSQDRPNQLSEFDGRAPPFHTAYNGTYYSEFYGRAPPFHTAYNGTDYRPSIAASNTQHAFAAAYNFDIQQQAIQDQAHSRGRSQYDIHHGINPAPVRFPYDPRQLFQPYLMKRSENAGEKPTQTCVICFEDRESSEFLHQCPQNCHEQRICSTCLKYWVMEACRNESKMPPKCCSVIPLSAFSTLLSSTEIDLYKSKYEEWTTPNRLYCPQPTCSAFIPPKLYLIPEKPPHGKEYGEPTSGQFPQSGDITATQKSRVACPACCTSVCTHCRSISHVGECSEKDIDPLLEKQLKDWQIKRCPKCRGGIRHTYGCLHIACRCGAHFCFHCLKPMNQSHDGCAVAYALEKPQRTATGTGKIEQPVIEDDDLDGHARFFDGDGHDFGAEPGDGVLVDTWACQHVWGPWFSRASALYKTRGPECQMCFQPDLKQPVPPVVLFDPQDTTHHKMPWECIRCRIVACGSCVHDMDSVKGLQHLT